MKRFLIASLVGAAVLAGLLALVIEWVCLTYGMEWREPLYWGGAAGFLINALGYPFMLKLATMSRDDVKAGKSWNWWLPGVLARMVGIGLTASAMRGRFSGHENGVTLTMVAVYMAGMFAELAWIGKRFNAMDDK